MLNLINMYFRMRAVNEKGFTLLEYCAGAAVLVTLVYGAFNALGGNLQGFFQALGEWVANRQGDIGGTGGS